MKDFDTLTRELEEKIRQEEEQIYSKKAREEAYNPKNVGELDNPDGAARITGPCGDTMQIHLRVDDEKITDSRFITDGCGASVACGSVITQLIKGKAIEEALKITPEDVLDVLDGLPDDNVHCAVLAVETLRAAINDYRTRQNGERMKSVSKSF